MVIVEGGDQPSRPRPSLKLFVGGLLFGRKVTRILVNASRDEFTPEGVPPMDKRAHAIWEAALGLAGDDEWDDHSAIEELLRLAGRHRDALRVAEIQSRNGGDFVDLPIPNRAQRLLEAALTGRPVRQVTADDERRMEIVDAFDDLPADEAWDELVRRVPGLSDLFDDHADPLTENGPLDESGVGAAHPPPSWTAEELERLRGRIAALLGPQSGSSDVVVGSVYARNFAVNHLLWLSRFGRHD
jgi:hypothetical protein